jgi:hypothetical protein
VYFRSTDNNDIFQLFSGTFLMCCPELATNCCFLV